MTQDRSAYYLPNPSHWPVLGCTGLFLLFAGGANWLHYRWFGPYLFSVGFLILILMLFGWFAALVRENSAGCFDRLEIRAFRSGMIWFIISEIVFFGAFFGALFFTRLWAIPELGGEIHPITHLLIWPDFNAEWPLLHNPDNDRFTGAQSLSSPWGIPALNTGILLTSGVTITVAHRGLKSSKRLRLIGGLALTIALGVTFLCCQASEYYQAYTHHGLTLNAGIYGSLFFILTGFHGAHVTIGTIMLIVILYRSTLGHFTPARHFAFQAVAWYWHFVDMVWLLLFVFVYWL